MEEEKQLEEKAPLDKKSVSRLFWGSVVTVVCALAGGLAAIFLSVGKSNLTAPADIPHVQIAENILSAHEVKSVPEDETAQEQELPTEPEETYADLTAENWSNYVTVTSCEVSRGTGNFVLNGTVQEKPASDDDYFYLLEMKMYETEPNPSRNFIASVPKELEFSLTAQVNENKPDTRLFSKFVVAVKVNGEYTPLCAPHYITNPEALAAYTGAFPQSSSIKGLLVDPEKLRENELDDLGVRHAAYNIPIANILGETTNPFYPTIRYTYDGRTYAFNGQRIAEYDLVFSTLTAKGITTTAILLNNRGPQTQTIHPLSRNGSANYYAFNTADDNGIETLAAVGAFLAQRYRSPEKGIVMNWVVGNEVNVRSVWNYMKYVDLDTYSREYANAVRLFYNSIKSMNANARVYVSMDQRWDYHPASNESYAAKDMLLSLNQIITEEGNMDWGLAFHPYAFPLTNTTFWASRSKYVTSSANTPMITMQNLHVLTDFMQKAEMKTKAGEVRPILLSELGYTSTAGETNQAAAYAYAYYAAASNPYIDALILSRETDASLEMAEGLALGLCNPDGSRKYIYEVFKHIDRADSEAYTDFAKGIIGINNWGEIPR